MSALSQTTKRATIEPATKPPCNIHSLAIIADKVQITGSFAVEIGENTILHPYVKIKAERGRVSIGKNCVISEKAVVGVFEGEGDVVIGDEVNIETGAVVEAKSVGDCTAIEIGATIGKDAVLGRHCKIAPLEKVAAGEELPDFTVVHSDNKRRHNQTMCDSAEVRQARHKNLIMQLELLKRLIPDASSKWR